MNCSAESAGMQTWRVQCHLFALGTVSPPPLSYPAALNTLSSIRKHTKKKQALKKIVMSEHETQSFVPLSQYEIQRLQAEALCCDFTTPLSPLSPTLPVDVDASGSFADENRIRWATFERSW